MGTRAAFWIGDPRNLEDREWLGCIAWDGCPGGDCDTFRHATTEAGFRKAVHALALSRDDFARPDGGWPYPWHDDIFLTDYTYAFFDGEVQLTAFYAGFMTFAEYDAHDGDEAKRDDDPTLRNVPAPAEYDRRQPDSIMIFGAPND